MKGRYHNKLLSLMNVFNRRAGDDVKSVALLYINNKSSTKTS